VRIPTTATAATVATRHRHALHPLRSRTHTTRQWTGLTDDRIRKLYRAYLRTADAACAASRKSPRHPRSSCAPPAAQEARAREHLLPARLLDGGTGHGRCGVTAGGALPAYEIYRQPRERAGDQLRARRAARETLGRAGAALRRCPCGVLLVTDPYALRPALRTLLEGNGVDDPSGPPSRAQQPAGGAGFHRGGSRPMLRSAMHTAPMTNHASRIHSAAPGWSGAPNHAR